MIRQFSKSLTTYRSFSILSRQLVGNTQAMEQTSKLANEQSANIENKVAGGWNKTIVDADEVDKSKSKSFKENLDRDLDKSGKGYQKVNPNAGNTHVLKDT